MAYLIQASTHRELLPYPILIKQILKNQAVYITCDKFHYSFGPLDGVTLAKSISTLKTFQEVKAYTAATSSALPRQVEGQSSYGSKETVTFESLHQDVCSLKKRVEQGFKKLEDRLKKIFDILGCRQDDVDPGVVGPSSSHHAESTTAEGGARAGAEGDDDDDHSHGDETTSFLFIFVFFSVFSFCM